MLHDLPLGRALRRFRRLNGIKQGHVAELLAVSQAAVSRWESGIHEPEAHQRERILDLIAANASNDADATLKRLIESSILPVHLVCDATHNLLAASPERTRSWGAGADAFIGKSLWRFASPEIVAAQEGLQNRGWFERPCQRMQFETGANDSDLVTVLPGTLLWETIPLADGRTGRISTTLA
ncbi:XRE family transcriptional regulator [Sphingomonas koreensis]|jgi:transcriptional regulator with XRE-family HTH domain|uniref:XRE family transcriptional regulator n=1 Tax=Sphingomonas koreensis TaxID=93064 RepID=A0A2M8WGD3_9SPHN|nr:helix-turn-helix transcriptional regulator [Sphingomonas koreensis]MDC7809419.1 helix-turn-helix transcriptional regulator [Sphingomonas koreensis]PJI89981.1 helix-turn-helix protein [Sphingomonas koreensis]RSU16989.1 XRE family transcriptional regulator [Sphingomonas koreensis]RSU18614.1 XRE family transcriptional regulator [Sphingomonas koreensis]RSU20802.1 XRE family transcriptional regulator [Sphingomonas koreensis]